MNEKEIKKARSNGKDLGLFEGEEVVSLSDAKLFMREMMKRMTSYVRSAVMPGCQGCGGSTAKEIKAEARKVVEADKDYVAYLTEKVAIELAIGFMRRNGLIERED